MTEHACSKAADNAPRFETENRINLIGLDRDEMQAALASVGLEKFRTKQVWQWIYIKGVRDFSEMTNIAKKTQALLEENFVVGRDGTDVDLTSVDGTRKWLFNFNDGNQAETVYIPEGDRGTLCVSSQVGCTLTCKFCHTGTQLLVRNLTSAEIVGQLMHARDAMGEWTREEAGRSINNIVMMGMGEPLYNYENVAKALKICMDSDGLAMSRRKITLSTSGVVPMMDRCGKELGVNLAVSLHAVNDELRNDIVPINKKYPIKELLNACRTYASASNARRITFEYVMLKGINDSDADARELVRLLKGINAKVNLIPFNPWPDAPYECSSGNRIKTFSDIIFNAGFSSPVRKTRGQDIFAACGQLKSASERKRKYPRKEQ